MPTKTVLTHYIHSTHVYNVVFLGYLYKNANETIHFCISNEQIILLKQFRQTYNKIYLRYVRHLESENVILMKSTGTAQHAVYSVMTTIKNQLFNI